MSKLNTTPEGLKSADIEKKLNPTSKTSNLHFPFIDDIQILFRQFSSPLIILLIVAAVISLFLGDPTDASIIIGIISLSGLLGFFQERNAGKVAEKLQSLLVLKAEVIRDGKGIELPANQIVPGDIILLKAGDMLPADCLILESNELHVNEASLTGESFPVSKSAGNLEENTPLAKRYNSLWEGTSIVSGNAKAIVIHTGEDTVIGNLKKRSSASVETSFEKDIKDFGFFLLKVTVLLTIFILIVNILNHKGILESALFALALAVGMAPELLPAITVIAMSAGAKRMLEKKVLVKKLNSIENLGEVNLLCTDKTGTITEGKIQINKVTDPRGNESQFVKELAFLNASLESGYLNPIDEALKSLDISIGYSVEKSGEVPYDFNRKRLSIAFRKGDENILVTKGAFRQILEICTQVQLSENHIEDIGPSQSKLLEKYATFGEAGQRAIAVAYKYIKGETITKEDECDLIFAGFVLVNDPIKHDIISTINELKSLNVGLKIITGDNENIAKSIARSLGIVNPEILTGPDMDDISAEALPVVAQKTHIFAEVEPQQKERIILALKKYHTVAYMGDGINDVSAIHAADVGISVNNAVDVARDAADFVLMEQNLSVLADGIKEGRKTFANTMKYIYINTGSTFGNMFSLSFASLVLPFLPMLPKQILVLNFLTSLPFLSVASDNVDEEQLRNAGNWSLQRLRRFMMIFGFHSSLFDILTFLILFFYFKVQDSVFQTGWFIESMSTQLFIIFIVRTHKVFYKSKPARFLFIFSIIGLMTTLILPYSPLASTLGLAPLPFLYLSIMILIAMLYGITADLLKRWFFKTDDFRINSGNQ